MAEQYPTSESSATMPKSTDIPVNEPETMNAPKVDETLASTLTSNEATVESHAQGGTESACNNNAESSAAKSNGDREKSLEYADELMEKGSKAVKESDFAEATECYSRALEIRAGHYGELAPECVHAYYKYGCALLYKAQEEADPLGSMPKKESEEQNSEKDGPVKNVAKAESSTASISSNAEQDMDSNQPEGTPENVSTGKDQEEEGEESDVDDVAEAEEEDEDESDLDLAWKMLDVARAIVEKHSGDTMEKVDILSSLAEVSLEREDIQTSLSDYLKALSILERLVEPDSRLVAELNFRICLCLEIGSKAEEAIPYCQKAVSICKLRIERLKTDQSGSQSDKESEIETLNGLAEDLEKKLEDLQQLASNPTSIMSEIMGIISAKAKQIEKSASSAALMSSQMGTANSNGDLDSPTVSTAHTNGGAVAGSSGVTHLGVVGRGVKRVLLNPESGGSAKKPAQDKGDGNA